MKGRTMSQRPSHSLCRAIAFFALCVVAAVVRVAAAAPAQFDTQKLAAIHDAMQKFVDNHELLGAVTVVGTSQGIVYIDAAGRQTLASEKPMTKEAIFRIASMTKPMTSLA